MNETQEPSTRGAAAIGLKPIGAGLSVAVIFLVFLSLPVEAAPKLGLTPGETAGWILGLWTLPGIVGLVLTIRHRLPIVMTGNLFVMILVLRVSSRYAWPDLVGAAILAGLVVLVTARSGLNERLNRWLPPPVIYGLLAGAVLPFMTDMFTMTADFPLVVPSAVITYLVTRKFVTSVPPILPAVLVAAVATALTGDLLTGTAQFTLVTPELTAPSFDLTTILAVTPVMVILITIQSNVPSIVFLREQGYTVDADQVTSISGLGTLVGSVLGPIGLSLSLPLTAVTSTADAGKHDIRYRAAAVASIAGIAMGVFAGAAAGLIRVVAPVIVTVAIGLAFLGVIVGAISRMTDAQISWGPVLTFIIAASDLTLLGLSSFFWAIVTGVAISALIDKASETAT